MPFDSDKQRRYLFSQKPEVARQIAYKNEGGDIMGQHDVKKMIKKDRYGNSMTYEFEVPKPLDETAITKHMMDKAMDTPMQMVDGMDMEMSMGIPEMHPGGPKGSDTVPAWLTPGEFVVNKEATEMFKPQIEAMNDVGRQMQQGGGVSYKQLGGLQESYDASYRYIPPVDESQKWFDQEGIDNLESMIPENVKKAAALLHALEQGEISAKKSWKFNEGGSVPLPESYVQTLLEEREGYRDDVYLDSLGKPTVGHGHLLPEEYKSQVGKKPFSKEELDNFFKMDIETATKAAQKNIKNFDKLNKKQQGALISMAFQLGPTGQSKFENMIDAIENERWDEVGPHALDSRWASQTPKRAQDIVEAFNMGGPVPQYYKIGDWVNPINVYDWFNTQGANSSQTGASGAHTGSIDTLNNAIDWGTNLAPYIFGQADYEPIGDDIWADDSTTYVPPEANQIHNIPTPANQHLHEDVQAGEEGHQVPTVDPGVPELSTVPYDVEGEEDLATYRNLDVNENLLRQREFDVTQTDKKIEVAKRNLAGVDPAKNPKKYNKYAQDLADLEAEKERYSSELAELTEAKGLKTSVEERQAAEDAERRAITLQSKEELSAAEAAELEQLEATTAEELSNDSETQLVDSQVNGSANEETVAAAQETANNMSTEEKDNLLTDAKNLLGKAGEFLGFTGQDVGRLALYYAAGRLTGGSHGGSLKWAGLQMLNENQARRAAEYKLAQEQAKNTGLDISGTPKRFELSDGTAVRAVFDKNTGDYIYNRGGKWTKLPADAREPNEKFSDLKTIQDSFDKDIESGLKFSNAKKEAAGEAPVTADIRGISAQGLNIYEEFKDEFGKTTAGSEDLKRKIGEALKEVANRGGDPSEVRGEVNKKLVQLRTGVSNNDVADTSTANFAELDALIKQGPGGEQLTHEEYVAEWTAAKNSWASLSDAKKKKYQKAGQAEGWNGFTFFAFLVQNDDPVALEDAGL